MCRLCVDCVSYYNRGGTVGASCAHSRFELGKPTSGKDTVVSREVVLKTSDGGAGGVQSPNPRVMVALAAPEAGPCL